MPSDNHPFFELLKKENLPSQERSKEVSKVLGSFSSRSDIVEALVLPGLLTEGVVFSDGQVDYIVSNGSTDISDMPNVKPYGKVYPDHWATNTTPGTTNMSEAIVSALSFSKDVYFKPVEYLFEFTSTNAITPQANTTVNGIKGSQITFRPHDTSYRNLFSLVENGLLVDGMKIVLDALDGSVVSIFNVAKSDLSVINCEIDGGVSDDGASLTLDSYLFTHPSTGTQDKLRLQDSIAHNLSYGFLKTNTATSEQKDIRVIGNDLYNIYKSSVSLNSPKGVCEDVTILDNDFYDDGTIDYSAHAGVTANIALAAVSKFNCSLNRFKGAAELNECIHIEGESTDGTINGNIIECYQTGIFCLDSELSGSPISASNLNISDNIITKLGTQKEAGSVGIDIVFDDSGTPPLKSSIVSSNIIKGFDKGILSASKYFDGVVISDNSVFNCAAGFVEGYNGQYKNNTTIDCDVDFSSSKSGFVEDHTFINPTAIVSSSSEPISIINPSFKWGPVALGAGVTEYVVLAAVGANDRVYGNLTYHVRDQSTVTSHALENFEVTWDGTTFTSTQKVSLQPGSTSAAPTVGGGNLRIGSFSASATTAEISAKLNGAILFT